MDDGTRIIFVDDTEQAKIDFSFLKSYWPNFRVVEMAEDTSVDEIMASVFNKKPKQFVDNTITLKDNGLEVTVKAKWIKMHQTKQEGAARYLCITLIDNDRQYTSDAVKRYLDQHGIIIEDVLKGKTEKVGVETKEHILKPFVLSDVTTIAPTDLESFIANLLDAMGYAYYKNVSISFPYAGIQVKATSNLVSTGRGNDFLIDFEDLYGDAIQEIKKTGLNTIQLKKDDSFNDIMKKILIALRVPYINDPVFFAAKRGTEFNTELRIPGYLLNQTAESQLLISTVPLHNRILQFLNEEGIKVILAGLFGA
jgi:hypothetical protein